VPPITARLQLHGYLLTSDLGNLFSTVHSQDEYLCQVLLKSVTGNKC